jgi:hypothetical protein
MDGIGSGLFGNLDNLLADEITLRGGGLADMISFVRHTHMQRATIGIRKDRYASNAEVAAGADDADGDFASVGNQYLSNHRSINSRRKINNPGR